MSSQDRERRIAFDAEQMLRISRVRERHKILWAAAAGCFVLGIFGGMLTRWIPAIVFAASGVLFIFAGRDAMAGGDIAMPVSVEDDPDPVNTATLEAMSPRQRAGYARWGGLRLILFGIVMLLVSALFAFVAVVHR